jgi:hypothetical protein
MLFLQKYTLAFCIGLFAITTSLQAQPANIIEIIRQTMIPSASFTTCDIGTTSITVRVLVPIPNYLKSPNNLLGEVFYSGGIEEIGTVVINKPNTNILPQPSFVQYFSRNCFPFFGTSNTTRTWYSNGFSYFIAH